MSENWSTWIIGHIDQIAQRRRSQVSFCYYTVSHAVKFLAAQEEYRCGVACISYQLPSREKHKQIAGLGQSARYVSLEEIVSEARLSTVTGVDNSDFLFVPCGKRSFPKTRSGRSLIRWAHESNLPDVNVHDNDHVWFCGFPRCMEKKIFIEFLKVSPFNIDHRSPRISRGDWSRIRQGLFDHGYTLNRSLCSSANGIFTYVLWAGIPETTLLRTNPKKPLSMIPEKLVLTLCPDDEPRVQSAAGKCPLTREYGVLSE